MSTSDTKFKVDQKVVYPSQGVGRITEIFEKTFNNQNLLYYKIYLDVSDMIVMVPVSKADDLGIRPIVSAEEAQKAIDLLGEDFEPVTSDWKLRYQMNLELLKKGSIVDIATIVRCLYHRSKVKELPILERKLYDSAKKLLEDEISFAMNISTKEVEDLLHKKLEPLGVTKEVKRILDDDEDDDDEEFEDEDTNDEDKDDRDDADESDEQEEEEESDDDFDADDE